MKKTVYTEKKFSDFREIINYSAAEYKTRPAFQIRSEALSGYNYISYDELKKRYYSLCNRFIADGLLGKRIAVTGRNCFEWVLCYLCAATVGIAVPIDKELHSEDLLDFMNCADCRAICADDEHFEMLESNDNSNIINYNFQDIMALSDISGNIDYSFVNSIELPADKMQVLIFTSGTTGSSKGVCLSQYNICADIHSTVSIVKITETDKTLSVLPLHHTYECTLNCLLLLSRGAVISYCDALAKIQKNLNEYKPTVLVVVPALLKILAKRVKKAVAADCPKKYKPLYENLSLAEAIAKTPYLIRKIIRSKVRNSLGGRLRLFIVGAAELDTSLVADFQALGIRTLQGYGLTECSPLLAGNSDFYLNAASTGKAVPGVQLKIDRPNEDGIGEILAKGDNIMLGYFEDEKSTRKVFRNGWFCTGDLGRLDRDGALYITGRQKNVIVTSNGKNIYPEELENRLSEHEEIGEVLVMADKENGESLVKAKILPNLDYIKERLGRLPSADEIKASVHRAITDVNARIPQYKHIKVVEILTIALEKTTTQKIKRFGANIK